MGVAQGEGGLKMEEAEEEAEMGHMAWQREPQACTHCIVRHIKTLGPSDTFFVCVW